MADEQEPPADAQAVDTDGREHHHVDGAGMEKLIDESEVRRIHWKIWSLSAMGIFLDGFDFFVIAVALPLINEQFNPASWELGLIASSALLGSIVGAVTIGHLTDVIGRRTIYVLDLAMFIGFTLLSAFSWGVWPLIIWRFGVGIAVGADYPISAAFVSEIMPKKVRGRFLVGAFSFQAAGAILGALASLIILWLYPEASAWRWMLLLGVVPAVAIAILRRGVPESPRWLISNGQEDEAAEVVSLLVDKRITVEKAEKLAKKTPVGEEVEEAVVSEKLFHKKYRRRTILTTIPWFLQDIATYGIGIFTPTIIGAIAIAPRGEGDKVFIADAIAKAEETVFVDIALVIGFAFAIIFIERIGRMKIQINGFIWMGIGLVILAVSTYMQEGSAATLTVVFVGFIIFNFFMNFGPNSTTYVLPVELYPTKLRATAHGFAASFAKAGAAVGAFAFPVIQDNLGIAATLYIVAGAAFTAAIVTAIFRIEPKGRSLDESGAAHPGKRHDSTQASAAAA